jgi:hypothetical protein
VRGVTLTALPTHAVHSAAFGPYGINEMLYAKQLIADVPNESLTLFDRGTTPRFTGQIIDADRPR